MTTLDRLNDLLGDIPTEVLEVRIRAGKAVQYRLADGDSFGGTVTTEEIKTILAKLTDHSLYTREAELRQGFFTMRDGCRVGVCGHMLSDGERIMGMSAIGSICVRICREIRGASDGFYDALFGEHARALRSALIASPPGMGKTTALRDAARRLSEEGYNVCVADERHELAACVNGVPTLDVGPRTDVLDGCPKHIAIMQLLRAASPQVIVTDEIGSLQDAAALTEAARCGVRVLASAHAGSIDQLLMRRGIVTDVFDVAVLLGNCPGRIKEIRELKGE